MLVRRLWLIFAALCCLPIAVFVLSLDLFREFGSGDAQQIDLVMGSQRLRADRAYTKWVNYPVGAHVEEIRYRALLPDMRPKDDAGSSIAFDKQDKDDIIITLQRRVRPWANRSTVAHIGALKTHTDDPANTNLSVTAYDHRPARDLFYRLSETGSVDWFAECDKPEEEEAPTCLAVERRFTTIGVSYEFDRVWLTGWQDVRSKVSEFVSQRLVP